MSLTRAAQWDLSSNRMKLGQVALHRITRFGKIDR